MALDRLRITLLAGIAAVLWVSVFSFAAAQEPIASAPRSVAFYYGAEPPWDELRAFDVVVVEPAHVADPRPHSTAQTQVFAYVSVGEVERDRPYAKDVPAASAAAVNEPWNSVVIDQTQPEWPAFLVERIVAPLWNAGYRGFFLDTLDSFHLIAKTEEQRARQVQGLTAAVRAIRARFPDARLIFNRGFDILPELHRDAYAVAAESIFHGWDQKTRRYVEVSAEHRAWLLDRLKRVREEYRLPVIGIDYAPPAARERARDTARRIAALGFIPWVANSDLDQLGVGTIEVMPRKILVLYESDGNEFSLMDHRVHRLATMPLNYLGYKAEYADIDRTLPAHPLVGRYAGIVTWFSGEELARRSGLRDWLARQHEHGVKIAILGSFGFPYATPLAKSLGLTSTATRRPPRALSIDLRDAIIGFETPPAPDRRYFVPLRAAPQSKLLLRVRSDSGETMDAAALTAWGGYVLAPFEFASLPGDAGDRWVVNPIEFFRHALALPPMPVPDVTTENGRRLMIVHVDGDGFVNRAERPGTPFAGEVLLNEVLQRYRIPHTVSIIQGEIAADGLYPKLAPRLESIARRIFALPHVEIASHTYSHPFRWSGAATRADPEAYHLEIPGYRFDLAKEIRGSIDYIDSRLAPKGKRTRMILWTGDTNPGRDALAMAYAAGVLNLNGGDTTITRRDRTLARVAPLGIPKGGYFQVYAPNQNENVYTNLWTGPFYGYRRAIETFELTDRPYRLKPIGIYYHFYSASKRASLDALDSVYRWALGQPVINIHASRYAQKVLDFNRTVVARSAEGWLVRGAGAVRELRAPAALGVPHMAESLAVAGFQPRGDELYVHLAAGDALLRFTHAPQREPRLVEANAHLENWRRDGSGIQFALRGHTPLRFALANVAGCRVESAGTALNATTKGDTAHYALAQHGLERISITCPP